MFGVGQADFENAESLSQRFTLTHPESARAAPRPGWASGPGPELATPSVTGGIGSSKAANGEGILAMFRTASTIALMSQSTSPVRGSHEVFVDDLGMFLGFVLSRPGP